ncbi:MAG: hypothetical protein ACRC3Y_10310 [Romboutsia sp.]|uniref:hypothetical protein n=1 Tax=Romboutsia sp. TaxID=1965302 RepID=UPI003F417BCE
MSRLEKTIQQKSKRRKWRFINKILFILLMSVNLCVCIFIVDNNAKAMLGEDVYEIEPIIKEIKIFIEEKIGKIDTITKDILVQLNK